MSSSILTLPLQVDVGRLSELRGLPVPTAAGNIVALGELSVCVCACVCCTCVCLNNLGRLSELRGLPVPTAAGNIVALGELCVQL